MKEKRILVTGAGGSGGSNFISSLRLEKDENFYIVGCDIKKEIFELTEGVQKKYILPAAEAPDYFDKLNRIIEKENIELVHCQSEQEVWAIAHNLDKVKAKTLFPDKEMLEITYDKSKLNEVLKKNGIKVPRSYHIKSREDIQKAFDVLLKEQDRVWLRATKGGGSRGALPVNTMLQAEGWIDYWMTMRGLEYSDFMICEFLPNKEFAFQSIWYNGEVVTSMARERVVYLFGHLFPSGQSSSPSVAKTVHRDDVNALATKAIKAVDPKATGVFCCDIKEDVNKEPCVTEINTGRFFTTSNNFSTAGINMPYYYILMGLGLKDQIPADLPQYNGIPAGWYWVRMMDMGYKLVKGEEWSSIEDY